MAGMARRLDARHVIQTSRQNKGRATRWAARPEPDDRNASERFFVGFAGADADGLLDRGDEDLAVADLAGARGLDHGLDGLLDAVVGQHHLDADLGQEIDHVLGAAVKLGMALLAAEALNLGDGQAADADLGQRFANFVELEGFDDGGDLFHFACPGFRSAWKAGRGRGARGAYCRWLRGIRW